MTSSSSKRLVVDRDVMVPMRDGVCLATDVYRPDDLEEHPVLVHRIPYGKSIAHYVGSQMVNPILAAEHGYVVVIQDCRGSGASEGLMTPYAQEAYDGYDCIEWAAIRPWSDGNVGIYGSSYMGVTCLQAVVASPPHLRAAMSYLTAGNLYQGWLYSGGALEVGFNMGYTQGMARRAIPRLSLDPERAERLQSELRESVKNRRELVSYLPLGEAPVLREKDVVPYWQEYLDHPNYDDYWRELDVAYRANEMSVPLMQIAGWYDQFLKGHLDLNQALKNHPDSVVRDSHRFVIGPWDHNSYEGHRLSAAGEREFGPEATSGAMAIGQLLLQWFDYWLRGIDVPLMSEPRVRYFTMAGEKQGWRYAESWPPVTDLVEFFLHSEGSANSRYGDGVLDQEPQGDEKTDRYIYDPRDPVPTSGGRTFGGAGGGSGVVDQSTVEERDDVLVYSSCALEEELSIAGNVILEIWISSSAPDTDFTAKLVDVEPSGYCAIVCDGILRARFRNSFEFPEFLTPGEPTKISIDLWDTAYTFARGHRLRLEVSSSNFPRFSRNANSIVQPERAAPTDLRVADQIVFHDSDHSSRLVLPVLRD